MIAEGSGRIKLDDEVHDLRQWDVLRIGPGVMRNLEAGSDGITLIAFGAPIGEENDGEIVPGWWPDPDEEAARVDPRRYGRHWRLRSRARDRGLGLGRRSSRRRLFRWLDRGGSNRIPSARVRHRTAGVDASSLFAHVRGQLRRADLAIGNLEGDAQIRRRREVQGGRHELLRLPGSPRARPPCCAAQRFDDLNVANNHAFDYGASGQQQTLRALAHCFRLRWSGRPHQITERRSHGVREAIVGVARTVGARPARYSRGAGSRAASRGASGCRSGVPSMREPRAPIISTSRTAPSTTSERTAATSAGSRMHWSTRARISSSPRITTSCAASNSSTTS